jgi:hypothetical protein|tara:strand:- start:2653 stop:2931 length:279 start_codon:yes stop_codon:yes gene_type:complete
MEIENTTLTETVEPQNELKTWLVDYVGNKAAPDSDEVTVENIVDVMSTEFPEFLMAVAEENWVRGYQQALEDVEEGQRLVREEQNETVHSGE